MLELLASTAARWAPGGSVVAAVDADRCRLTIGGWSCPGIAGLFITLDTGMSEPDELRNALAGIGERLRGMTASAAPNG